MCMRSWMKASLNVPQKSCAHVQSEIMFRPQNFEKERKRERKSTGVCRAVECHVKLESSKIDHRNVETSRAHVCDISKKEAQNGKTDCDASQIKCPTASLSLGTRKLHSCLFFLGSHEYPHSFMTLYRTRTIWLGEKMSNNGRKFE